MPDGKIPLGSTAPVGINTPIELGNKRGFYISAFQNGISVQDISLVSISNLGTGTDMQVSGNGRGSEYPAYNKLYVDLTQTSCVTKAIIKY